MTKTQRILVVIPAWNEEASVGRVVLEVRSSMPNAGILVVDDGSSDKTAEVARASGASVARLPFNLGVGGAMRVGFRYARLHKVDVVVQVDADGQHDPRDIPALLERLESADIVIGARFAGTGEYQARGPRRWAMFVLARILGRLARTRLTDSTSGFRASSRRAIDVFSENYPAEYLGDTVEALVIAVRSGLVVRQVPVAMRSRTAGEPSHHPLRASIYLARVFMALGFALMRPMASYSMGRTT